MKFTPFIFSLLICSSPALAITCPSPEVVKERIHNSGSTLEYEGLQYHVQTSSFIEPYKLNGIVFVTAELTYLDPMAGNTAICRYARPSNGEEGILYLQSNGSFPKYLKPQNGKWDFYAGYLCYLNQGDVKNCSFSLTAIPEKK